MKSPGDTLVEKANAAFRQAARKVIERARQSGTPIILWENGRVIERTWQEAEQALAKSSQEKTKPGEKREKRGTRERGKRDVGESP